MNILVVGECFSENLGDAVICQTVKKIINEKYADYNVTLFDLSGRIDYQKYYEINTKEYNLSQKFFYKSESYFEKIYTRNSCVYRNYKKDEIRHIRMYNSFLNSVKNETFDLVVFAGGALFMDFFSIPIYVITNYFKKKKTNIIFNSVGMGNLSNDSLNIFKRIVAFSNVKSITVRDSYDRFVKYFGNNKIFETYDIATNCNQYYLVNNEHITPYGIGIIGLKELKSVQKQIVEYFIEKKLNFKLFTNGANYDQNLAHEILEELGVLEIERDNYILKRPITENELIYNINSFEKIISFRMHSLIVASAYNISSIGIVWDNKIKEFYRKLGFEDYCIYPNELIESVGKCVEKNMDLNLLIAQIDKCSIYSKNVLLNEIDKYK